MKIKSLLLTLAVITLFGSAMQAQSIINSSMETVPSYLSAEEMEYERPVINAVAKTNVFYEEDFSNGFDGLNGAWTIEDSSPPDTTIWMMNQPGSPLGEFSAPTLALQSTTASNGWAIFDPDAYNTPISDGFEAVQGFLTSPSIDCSTRSTVILQYEQTFRYCCQQASPLTVEVSIDGGTEWTVWPGEGDFIPTANTWSGPTQLNTLDISCIAANEADVRFRFAYNSVFNTAYSHYFWGVDDVTLSENPFSNDMKINQVTNGDVLLDYEYVVTPIGQAPEEEDGGLLVGVVYENTGSEDQTNVVFTIEVLDDQDVVISTTLTEPFDLPAKRNSEVCPVDKDTIYQATNWVPEVEGQYTLRVSVSTDATLENTDDDVVERTIFYSACEFRHEYFDLLDVELRARDSDDVPGSFENTGHGNIFTFNYDGPDAIGAAVRFGPNTTVGMEVEIRLYSIEEGEFLNDAAFESTFYEVQPGDVPADLASSESIFIEFDDEVTIDPDVTYMVAAVSDVISEDELTILAWDESDSDNSSFQLNQNADEEFVWFSRTPTPAVGLVLDEDCVTGIEDIDAGIDLTSLVAVPNPTSGITTIRFSTEETLDIRFRIVDATGRVVMDEDMGTVIPGPQFIDLDLSNMSQGLYHYSILTERGQVTRNLMLTK